MENPLKPFLFTVMKEIIGEANCKFIGEIGKHHGGTAYQLVAHFAKRVDNVTYYGYDIFDDVLGDRQFAKKERNGKGAGSLDRAKTKLAKANKRYGNVSYEFFKGLTTDTLTKPVVFDFVYIDGVPSYESG